MKKILIVHYAEIGFYPPVKSLILNLLNNGNEVSILCRDRYGVLDKIEDRKFHYKSLPYIPQASRLIRLPFAIRSRYLLRKMVREMMKEHDLIWTATEKTAREIGKDLFNYNHVMQLMELVEHYPAFAKQMVIKANLAQYARRAKKVVVPEQNRAYIQQAWWNLPELPTVLPNKVYDFRNNIDEDENGIPVDVKPIIEKMMSEKRKIVLYSGLFMLKERPLEAVAQAIDELSEDFVFYIMGRDTVQDKADRIRLCEEHKNLVYIPFLPPPLHLIVTRHADIGLLSYTPVDTGYTPLNSAYCAPGKIFDYAYFGLPMIATDVPGITYLFEKYKMGAIYRKQDKEEVKRALHEVADNFELMSKNAKDYYDSVDLDKIVNEIIS